MLPLLDECPPHDSVGYLSVASLAATLAFGAATRHIPPACQLLTATDAATLAGFAVTQDPNSSGGGCLYNRTGASSTNSDAVEITVRTYPNAATAHDGYPKWVNPFPKPNPTIVRIPLSGLGDEATLVHITPGPGVAGIYFRSGANSVKMGVYPPVSDSALTTAARTIISRL